MHEKPRIMIVDDNPRARKALWAYLSTLEEFEMTGEASNGEDAVKKVESQTPDMVLMDIQMPVMDGLEATRLIKRHWPQIKIVVLTIYTNYRSEASLAGADAFLDKSCSATDMISTIHSLVPGDKVGNIHPSTRVDLTPKKPPQIA